MKKRTKLYLSGAAGLFAVVALTSCTKSFCSNEDTGRMLYAFDPGITAYVAGTDALAPITSDDGNYTYTVTGVKVEYASWSDSVKGFIRDGKEYTYLNAIIASARDNGLKSVDSTNVEYLKVMDRLVLESVAKEKMIENKESYAYDLSKEDDYAAFQRDLSFYSYLKYVDDNEATMWERWEKLNAKAYAEVGQDVAPSSDFLKVYKTAMTNSVAQYRTCLTTKTDKYGSYGYDAAGIFVEAKSWKYAWQKGFFEGLLVYPIGWLVDSIGFGFINSGVSNGWSALLAILFVTLIVRGLMLLVTLKQTAGNAKLTELQPEITKIQNKYPNANTSQAEKQRMAQEMQALYKKNKINPLSTILVMIVQFPIFICVWGALSGNALLSSGTVLGLDLSKTIREVLFTKAAWGSAGGYAAVTALFLFIFMAAAQTVAMLLPQWMQKAKAKKVARLGKNPAQQQQNNRMKWFTYIMLAMIIFMGFSLVSAMGVYWLVGALISIVQTLIMQKINARRDRKKK